MRTKVSTHPEKQRFGAENGRFKKGGSSRDYMRRIKGLKPNDGFLIHHKDSNPRNNKLSNLLKLKITGGPNSKTSSKHEKLTKRK